MTSATNKAPETGMATPGIFAREPGKLGIRIPRSAWKAAGHSASAAMRQNGFLISQGQLSEWIADDLCQVDDEVICTGPGFDGLSLEELLVSGFGEVTILQRLAAVARALNRLDRASGLPAGIQSAGVLVSANGDVLILPPSLVARAAARIRKGKDAIPEDNPAITASVMLAGILRRMYLPEAYGIAGATTDKNSSSKATDFDRRSGDPFVPLGLIAPRLDPGLAALADKAMGQNTGSPSMEDWVKAFDSAGKNKFFRELSTDELAGFELQRKATETRVARKLALRHFMMKRGGLLSGLAIAMIVIAAIAILDRPPPGPDLSEFAPEAIVQSYYEAIDTLDLALLEACLEGKAGREDKSLVTNLTVVMKMRQAYAKDELFISAKDWVASGSPELEEGSLMFGITDLGIRNLDLPPSGQPLEGKPVPEEASRYEARYTLWTTESSEESIRSVHLSRIDRLVLEKGKKGWKIVSIEREVL
jgi:hypothetical protein